MDHIHSGHDIDNQTFFFSACRYVSRAVMCIFQTSTQLYHAVKADIIELLKYASTIENAVVAGTVCGILAGIIVFFLLRKYTDSEYITGSKQNLEELRLINESIKAELSRIKDEHQTEIAELRRKLAEQQSVIEELKQQIKEKKQ